MLTIDRIRDRLAEIRPPGLSRDVVSLGAVRGIEVQNGAVTIDLELPSLPQYSLDTALADIRRAVGALDGVQGVTVRLGPGSSSPAASAAGSVNERGSLPGVRDIIAVASTKGGVGKSTVACNLALALSRLHQRVGLLDADVYGPSLPIMFGLGTRPRLAENKRIYPLEKYGVRLMSIGFFLDDSSPVIWRGPLVMGLVRQFLKDVEWGELDVLVVDMPPGTGDAQLTLVQQVPLAGGVMVTTPQDVATLDVQRGVAMFQQVRTPVLGIIENMSYYRCPRCGTRDDVFGSGGAERIGQHFGIPILGYIPLVPDVRRSGDAGKPIVIDEPDHPVSQVFLQIAGKVLKAAEVERPAATQPTIIG
jgi:ATP-binding protein involved in chromosome partitioning